VIEEDEDEDEDEEEDEAPTWKPTRRSLLGVAAGAGVVLVGVAVAVWVVYHSFKIGFASGQDRVFALHEGTVYGVDFAPDGQRAVSGGGDRRILVFDLETGTVERRLEGFPDTVNAIAWSSVEDVILTGGKDRLGVPNKSVKLWDINPNRPSRQLSLIGPTAAVTSVAFSPGGKLALTGGGGQKRPDLRLWDVASGQQLAELTGHTDLIFRVAAGPGGKGASCGFDRTLRIWDLNGRKELHCIELPDRALCLAFSPDGALLASGGEDKIIRLWDLSNYQEAYQLTGHRADVLGVAFTPDGRRLVSASGDRSVRVWDLETRREVRKYDGHSDIVINVAVSRDGTRALSCSQDRTVRLWTLPR
jgi:WD40 repeat protein